MSSTKQAAALEGLDYVKGTPLDLAAGKGTKVFAVEFWATWCPPCRTSIPHLTELAHKYKDTVEFVGITSETEKDKVEEFVKKMGEKMDYAVAMDTKGLVNAAYMQAYGVSGIPHVFVVDLEGNVAWHGHPAEPDFETALQTASAGKSASPKSSAAHHFTLEQITKMSDAELVHLSAKDLRGICQEYKIDVTSCLEKTDYVEVIHQFVSAN